MISVRNETLLTMFGHSAEAFASVKNRYLVPIKPTALPLSPLVDFETKGSLPETIRFSVDEGKSVTISLKTDDGQYACSLRLPEDQLSNQEIYPLSVAQQESHSLVAGVAVQQVSFDGDFLNDRFKYIQKVSITGIPGDYSDMVTDISLHHHASNQYGLFTYVSLIPRDEKLFNRLGVGSISNNAVVIITSRGVYVVTDKESIILSKDHSVLGKLGANIVFCENLTIANLTIVSERYLLNMFLHKGFATGYDDFIFGESRRWITDSSVEISPKPKQAD